MKLLALALFAALGYFIKQNNYLLLKVPRVGFILFAISGGDVPPFFNKPREIFAAEDQWGQPTDVFAVVPAKSGTTWMMYTLHCIRAKGSPAPFKDIGYEVRWPELVYYPGQPLSERVDIMKQTASRYPFAIYKAHFGVKIIGYRADAKYIVCARNPLDMIASFYPFLRSHDAGFAKMWGGFPPTAGQVEQPDDMEKHIRAFLVDGGGGEPFLSFFLTAIEDFWPYRHQPNVMFLHYTDRVKNPNADVRRLAEFIGVPLTDEEVDKVVTLTSFAEMKKESSKFDYNIFDELKEQGKVPAYVKGFVNELVNVGGARNGAKELPLHVAVEVRKMMDGIFGTQIADWLYNGGEMPDVELPVSSRS